MFDIGFWELVLLFGLGLMVLGPEEGLAWVEDRPWLEALLMVREGERVIEKRVSSGWDRWQAPEN